MLPGKTRHLEPDADEAEILAVHKALGSPTRWHIMQCLAAGSQSVNDLARALNIAASTVAPQVKILEEAGLIESTLRTASHGLEKVCTRIYDTLVVELPYPPLTPGHFVQTTMPIGAYTACEVHPTCGLAGETSLIGYLDDPVSFYEPQRLQAGLIWFRHGYLEYRFPNRLPTSARLDSVEMTMEICSEAPLHHDDWPSDITLWINDQEVGTWTSPADFGGRRGHLTPAWWGTDGSQYGLLKRWLVNADGAYVDGHVVSPVTIADLAIERAPLITVRLGVKRDALHVGGLNLFGHTFGNYPQDLTFRLDYTPGRRVAPVDGA